MLDELDKLDVNDPKALAAKGGDAATNVAQFGNYLKSRANDQGTPFIYFSDRL